MSLRLVTGYTPDQYPYRISIDPFAEKPFPGNYVQPDSFDQAPFILSREKIQRAIALAGIEDYFITRDEGKLRVHLRTNEDFSDFMIAYAPKQRLKQNMFMPHPIPKDIIYGECLRLKHAWEDAGMKGRFKIIPQTLRNGFSVETSDDQDFFRVRRLLTQEYNG